MTVIEASSGTYSSRVDGTLVLRVEIEPRFAKDAIALFGGHGTPMALAALKVQSSKPTAEVGELCRWAAIRCTEAQFQNWCEALNEAEAARYVRRVCDVESRTELDTNPEAAARLHSKIRLPYAAWLKKQTVSA